MTENEALEYIFGKFHFLPKDTLMTKPSEIEKALIRLKYGNYCLVILDPISDVIAKIYDNEYVKPRVTKLVEIAESTNTTIIYSINRKKDIKEVPLINHGLGAVFFSTIPRLVLYQEKIAGTKQESIIFKVKNSYGDLNGGAIYSYKPSTDGPIGMLRI